ncbi:hypothetical protein [Sphingobacterium suaedae]|uniref:Uncharacterized protein n=1 Tax=Sphingobacterium suaedae TaxID=1686402 RepID=A0ABW5KDK7_9SPHI
MEKLLKVLQQQNRLHEPVEKYTLLVDEEGHEHGVLFFIPNGARNYKIMLPAPYHLSVLQENQHPTIFQILRHKEAMLLQ